MVSGMIVMSTSDTNLTNSCQKYSDTDTESLKSISLQSECCDSVVPLSGIETRIQELQEDYPPPSFGNVSVVNSNDVHFGNKTFYQGPVTIKQFLYPNEVEIFKEEILSKSQNNFAAANNGLTNPAFHLKDIERKINLKDPNSISDDEDRKSTLWQGFHILHRFSQEHFFIFISVLLIFMMFLTIFMIVLMMRGSSNTTNSNISDINYVGEDTDEQDINKPFDDSSDPSFNVTLPRKIKIVPRAEWVAQPPKHPANSLHLPVRHVIISHTAADNCTTQSECRYRVRLVQMFHVESKHWWDIGYNFLVGGDGEAYEGRGWKSEGAHTFGFNYKSIGIAFIGTFSDVEAPKRQLWACQKLIELGIKLGYISKDYRVLGARQLQTTESPGTKLFHQIQKWKHWAPEPYSEVGDSTTETSDLAVKL